MLLHQPVSRIGGENSVIALGCQQEWIGSHNSISEEVFYGY